jgi:hypothetical protein
MEIKVKNNSSITKNTYLLCVGLKMKAHMPNSSSSLLLAALVHAPKTCLRRHTIQCDVHSCV